ncbi:MAG: hypothetical protein JRI57_09560 [Deltaproteobacteria bacterium]|nr:hypothetical protein [Deltaproteobacteria bacterium]MBW1953251.1 hypothetical protein [Deltaproteobacteria bacterium]MBW1987455.1 hypothetical protein [Deltaproteobacteria bacterium]MBW2135581.1 hypothetical protein [Deltaproteobacteria bacterium]
MAGKTDFFSEVRIGGEITLKAIRLGEKKLQDRNQLKDFLELVHIKKGLLEPYNADYPLIDGRELLPSFEINFAEYKFLPSFSMVVFNRTLDYQNEVFQFDRLHSVSEISPPESESKSSRKRAAALERLARENVEKIFPHLPPELRTRFKQRYLNRDLTDLANYEQLLEFIFHMDRAHVIARDTQGEFRLLGSYASFPSDLDNELKTLGRRLGKFRSKDNARYEANRYFVYHFLMELYGFPIASERRTSSALFARKLSRLKEQYLIKVLGCSDRVITSLCGFEQKRFPLVEKVALVSVPRSMQEEHNELKSRGFYVDEARRVVILKVTYAQHKYNKNNVQEDRALSVLKQEVMHPFTGAKETGFNILKDSRSFLIDLNDIVRGEYKGSISYKHWGQINSTKTHDDRLKFLYAWLSKNQRRITSYSQEFFDDIRKVLNSYILNPDYRYYFKKYPELHREVIGKITYLKQAHQIHQLEKMVQRRPPYNKRLTLVKLLSLILEYVEENLDEIPHYYDDLFAKFDNIFDQLFTHPYIKSLDDLEAAPDQPYQRKLYKMLIRLKKLKEDLDNDHLRVKQAGETGSFAHFLLHESLGAHPSH